ncbi:MAG: GNAT family N-acetyltransferase [Actinobacteria bacterium]|nr:GNAT family N-acetyltransferase [Actinomycetota bacterium]
MPLVTPTLHTHRLHLRPVEARDAEPLLALMSDVEVMRFWDSPPWQELGQAERFAQRSASMADDGSGVRLTIERADDEAFLGWCAVGGYDEDFRLATVTYVLSRHAWGHGYATEAMAAVVDWAYQNLDLNRLQTEVDTRNPPSARVLEKLGFTREGTLRENCIVDGDVSDSWIYGLIASDREVPGRT